MSIARNVLRRYLVWQTACLFAATGLTVPGSASEGEVVIETDIDYLGSDRAEKADLYRPRDMKTGLNHQLVIIEGAPHTFGLVNKQKDLRSLVVEFFDKNLKPAK